MPAFNRINKLLFQGSFPESLEMGIDYDIIINVSDCIQASLDMSSPHFYKKPIHYWLPICEWGRVGYEPFYAAKRIIDGNPGKRVLIHCEGGINRSVIIAYAYLLSHGRESEFTIGKSVWERFLSNAKKQFTKSPPRLLEFLLEMNKFPTYSVAGILQQLLGNEDDTEIVPFLNGVTK